MTKRIPIILDTDPGIDDDVNGSALFCALPTRCLTRRVSPLCVKSISPFNSRQAVMIVFSFLVLLQWSILGRAFRLVAFLQPIAAILFGY